MRRRTPRIWRHIPPPDWLLDADPDPFRQEWLMLQPGRRLARSWSMRRRIKNLEAAHDALSLPHL